MAEKPSPLEIRWVEEGVRSIRIGGEAEAHQRDAMHAWPALVPIDVKDRIDPRPASGADLLAGFREKIQRGPVPPEDISRTG